MLVMGEYKLLLFWRYAKNWKIYGTLKFLLTEDHMGLEIVHWLPWWNTCTGYYVLGNWPSFNNFMALRNFNMDVEKILRCGISWKWLIMLAKFPILWFAKRCSSSNIHPVLSKVDIRYHNHGPVQVICLFGNLPKINKNMAFWNFFYNSTIWSWKFQSAIFPTIFIGAHPNFLPTLVTMVNLNPY